jgi:hypothetical protein
VDIGWARISKNSKRVLVFNGLLTRKSPLAAIRKNSLDDDLTFSQDVGKFLANAGVQGLLFKSTVGTSVNLLISLDNCVLGQPKVQKLDEMIEMLKKIMTGIQVLTRNRGAAVEAFQAPESSERGERLARTICRDAERSQRERRLCSRAKNLFTRLKLGSRIRCCAASDLEDLKIVHTVLTLIGIKATPLLVQPAQCERAGDPHLRSAWHYSACPGTPLDSCAT